MNVRLKTKKRKLILAAAYGTLLSALVFSDADAVKGEYDFEIKKGIEIIGAEERPRVIFFLPELKIPLRERPMEKKYILKMEIIKKEVEFFKEEGK